MDDIELEYWNRRQSNLMRKCDKTPLPVIMAEINIIDMELQCGLLGVEPKVIEMDSFRCGVRYARTLKSSSHSANLPSIAGASPPTKASKQHGAPASIIPGDDPDKVEDWNGWLGNAAKWFVKSILRRL